MWKWGALDYLLIDLPPGTGDVQLTLSQLVPLTGAVTVTTPQEVALHDVRKGILMFKKVNVPILGIIENMSYYLCSHCGERSEIFSFGGGEKAAEKFEIPFLGRIPLDSAIRSRGVIWECLLWWLILPLLKQKCFMTSAEKIVKMTSHIVPTMGLKPGSPSISNLLKKIKEPLGTN